MKNLIPTKLALVCAAVGALMFTFNNNASALTIGDAQTLGEVFYGIPSGDADRTQYVNDLVFEYNQGHPDGFTFSASGQDYILVHGSPVFGATLPGAVFGHDGTGNTGIILAAVGTYSYRFQQCYVPHQGSVVWSVG